MVTNFLQHEHKPIGNDSAKSKFNDHISENQDTFAFYSLFDNFVSQFYPQHIWRRSTNVQCAIHMSGMHMHFVQLMPTSTMSTDITCTDVQCSDVCTKLNLYILVVF